jgi:hypothetical protein
MNQHAAVGPLLSSLVVSVFAVTLVPAVRADMVTLTPSRDNTIFSEGEKSNGAGAYLFVGNTGQGNSRRALVAFDLGDSIPAGSTVQSATFTLQMSRSRAGAEPVSVHRLLANWGEGTSNAPGDEGVGAPATPGDATWTHAFFGGAAWASPGGDFVGSPSATMTVDATGPYTWGPTSELTADVQGWVDASGTNFGWILIGTESGTQTAQRFGSRENSDEASRPTLTIEYSPPAPATSTPTPTPTLTPVPTVTATVQSGSCPGDCNKDGQVTVNELVTAVNIALGNSPVSVCENADRDGNGVVAVNELIAAVNASLTGCPT